MPPLVALLAMFAFSRALSKASPSHTRAAVVQGKFVMHDGESTPRVASLLVFCMFGGRITLGVLFTDPEIPWGWLDLAWIGLALLFVPQSVNFGRHFVFDAQGIALISPWTKRVRKIAWAELERLKQRDRLLQLRTRSDTALKVPITWLGFGTLSQLILAGMPKEVQIDERTHKLLLEAAKASGG